MRTRGFHVVERPIASLEFGSEAAVLILAGDACLEDRDCPDGQFCARDGDAWAACVWGDDALTGEGNPCRADSDCRAGQHCVVEGARASCRIPCFADEMTCPARSECRADFGWVCGSAGL